MCDICSHVGKIMTQKQVNDSIDAIGAAVSAGQDPEHFKQALDVLLSTETEDRDREAEAAWEDDYRGTD